MLPREHIADTLLHKQFVLQSGGMLVEYLFDNDRTDDAIKLAKRCANHDDSKFESDEMQEFLQLPYEGENMKEADKELPTTVKTLIAKHWKHNRHHPEFFDDYHQMNEIDIMEMVCDWYARSLQYHTDFKEFVQTRQAIRFHFDEEFFATVWKYCEIIDMLGVKNNKK